MGNIQLKAILTPGHTPEHMSFLVADLGGGADQPMAYLTGDFIFVGDVGRPDLLESAAGQSRAMDPSARTLYASLRAIAGIPDYVQILPAHGACSACGKSLGAVPNSVMGYERKFNAPFREALTAPEDQFVQHILSGQPEPPLYFARIKRDNKAGPALLLDGKLSVPQPEHPPSPGIADLRDSTPGLATLALSHLGGPRRAFTTIHQTRQVISILYIFANRLNRPML